MHPDRAHFGAFLPRAHHAVHREVVSLSAIFTLQNGEQLGPLNAKLSYWMELANQRRDFCIAP